MCTNGDDAATELDAGSLRTAWEERATADAALGRVADELFGREEAALDALLRSVAARSAPGSDEAAGEDSTAALATGRAAFAGDVDLAALQRLFGHLHEVVTGHLLGDPSGHVDGQLSVACVERAVRRAHEALETPLAEVTRGWFDEAGRKLRHDVKTPLQATSLNLELLTLESGERGLDTEALDTIQRSLDQVVELLARAEPANG